MRCQDCDVEGAVTYADPPDARGTFCRDHARWLPEAPGQRAGGCVVCGRGYSLAFWLIRDDGKRVVRRCCPEHRPPRTPGGRPARLGT